MHPRMQWVQPIPGGDFVELLRLSVGEDGAHFSFHLLFCCPHTWKGLPDDRLHLAMALLENGFGLALLLGREIQLA